MNKILLIDDDIDFLNLLTNAAGDCGWEPCKAASVKEAKELLMKESYHIVCIDFSLRGGTAIDILDFMKKQDIAGRAVVLSGHSEDRIRNAAFRQELWSILKKADRAFLMLLSL